MEDYRLDIIIDQGRRRAVFGCSCRSLHDRRHDRAGMVSAPLRSRFGMTARLDYYAADEMHRSSRAVRVC
jgi:Holliday junction DNA helicase RuvB